MYTSGRNVKSSAAKPTTVATATTLGRKLARKHLPVIAQPMVTSRITSRPDLTTEVRTEILHADGTDTADLIAALRDLPDVTSVNAGPCSVTYTRTA